MKTKAIKFFKNLPIEKAEQFNKGFALLRSCEGVNEGILRSLNMQGFTDNSLETLKYELQKAYSISDVEKHPGFVSSVDDDAIDDDSQGQDDGDVDQGGLVADVAKEQDSEIVLSEQKIRDEFPFLSAVDLPSEFKILVADRITAYDTYVAAKQELADIDSGVIKASADDVSLLAKKASDAFELNQLIYDELNVYNSTGEILGKHPIFRTLSLQRDVDAMDNAERIKYKHNSVKYMSENKSKLAEAKKLEDQDLISKIQGRIDDRSEKLFLVNKVLGFKPE